VPERRSDWLVVGAQVKACYRETHSPSRTSKTTVINSGRATLYSTPHTLWGCTAELASALTAATILADAAVTPPSPK